MPDLMRILDIARQALNAHQNAMSTASNNIANVNTIGYSRQRVNLTPTKSLISAYGILGSGVTVESIERIRSQFVDRQLLSERPSLNQFEFKSNALQFIEEIFNEPSDFGILKNLEDFYDSFHDLANDPESSTSRTVVRAKAVALTNGFKRIHRQLNDYATQLNSELRNNVNEVNLLTSQIANLNQQITDAEGGGNQAPTLRDRRDLLIDNLAELVDVQVFENDSGGLNVAVGGRHLVIGTDSRNLTLKVNSSSDLGPKVVFENGGQLANITNGSIKGLLDIRDVNITDYLSQLDQFAVNLAREVNTVHSSGYNLNNITNTNFFDPDVTGAADFNVSTEILNDADLIAASDQLDQPGNNNVALALANLQDSLVMNNGELTFNDFYNTLISTVGSQTQEANFFTSSFSLTVEKLELTRESISGVSLDEEMTHLIESQQAYTAATRVVTTVDEMINAILSMV